MILDRFGMAGRWAMVTGASRGIGRAVAMALAEAGANTVVTARSVDALQGVVGAIRDLGVRAEPVALEVTRPDSVARAFALAETFGPIDILVNNAGLNQPVPALELSIETFDRILATNLRGAFLCCQEAGRRMVPRRYGRVVNISSDSSLIAEPDRAHYGPSKAGLNALTRNLAYEWAPFGVTVNAVAPTFVRTDMGSLTLSDPARHAEILRNIPLGRLGDPADVAAAVVFLASSAADFLTGVVLPVDGGRHIV